MKIFFIEDFFINNVFYPFLLICLILGIISFILIIVHYFVCRLEEINDKENTIIYNFSNIKTLYKKKLVLLDEIINEISKFDELYGEYEKKIIQKINSEKFINRKYLDEIDNKGKAPNSIKSIIELDNIIDYSMQQIFSIVEKHSDIKSYSKYLTQYAEYKSLGETIETTKGVYNRRVREFNDFIMVVPYVFFAIFFKIEQRKCF